jgi:type VI secretion system FHA domain protein
MDLVLQIVNDGGSAAPERKARAVFGRAGGRIGRASDCEWVLPNPYVSRHHATVSHADGTFYIESAGENGVALNDPAHVLARFERHALSHGDRLFIDELEVSVEISAAGIASDAPASIPELHAGATGPLDPATGDLDPLRRLLSSDSPASLADTAARQVPWNNSSSLADHFSPPRLEQPARRESLVQPESAMPVAEDWNYTPFDRSASEPPRARVSATAPAVASAAATGFASATAPASGTVAAPALTAKSASGEPIPDFVRSMLQGLIDERQARAQVAAQLRLRNLPGGPSDQNPLRYAVNAQDAVRLLFASTDSSHLSAAQVIADALEEVHAHHLATCSAMQAAFQSMLSRFDPEALEERFERRLKSAGVLPIGSRLRYWPMYVEFFEQLATGHDGGFQQLFGEAFAGAYENQINALKGRRGGATA